MITKFASGQSESGNDSVHTVIIEEKMPEYAGGDRKLLEYIGQNVVYPPVAKAKGITGVSYVGYYVETDGAVGRVHVAQGAHPLLDAEAVRVVSSVTGYKPGTQNDKPVPVRFTMPVRFTLTNDRSAPQHLYDRALEELKEGNIKKAGVLLDKAIASGSTWFIEAYAKRAELALSSSDYFKAEQDYEAALRIDPTRFDLYIGKAKCLFGRDKVDEALAELDKAAQLNPYSAKAYGLMGLFCLNKGRFEEAELHYDKAIGIYRNDGEFFFNRGMAKARQLKLDEACEDWKRAKKFGSKEVDSLMKENCE